MLKIKYIKSLVLVFITLVMLGCGGDENTEPVIQNEYLVSANFIKTYTASEISLAIGAFGLSEISDLMSSGFSTYKLEYNTEYLGENIVASGLIAIPVTNTSVPLISLQHGTISSNADAPSVNPTSNLLFSAVASAGYIAIVPDFIGFGSSSDKLHPYYFEKYIAQPTVDMIRATKEYLKQEGIPFNNELFLGGYSEGGYVTMVTQKLIESSFANEFNLVASAPASGGYDIKHMQEYFFSLDNYHQPFYMAYVSMAYQTALGLDSEFISNVFHEPYASRIPTLFDGTKSGGDINAELTNNISELLTANFLDNFDTDTKFEPIRTAFLSNSPVNWIPSTPTFMYHGTADVTVPYDNSVVSYDKLIAAGASPNTVTFHPIQDGTHATGVLPYFIDVIRKFDDLK